MRLRISAAPLAALLAIPALAQQPQTASAPLATAAPAAPMAAPQAARKPPSPRGSAATQVLGRWEKQGENTRYVGGKWIEIDYGRPIKRGREPLFGVGAEYGKKFLDGSAVWRVGANATTTLTTEVALTLGGKKLEPGIYDLFVDLKENAWTLVVSTQKRQEKYDPNDKSGAIWGSAGYDPKFDVVRVPMQMAKAPHSIDQLTIGFLDVSDKGGKLAIAWDKEVAMVDFGVAP